MNTIRILAAVSLCTLVAACSTAQLAATGTRAALSEETVARIAGLCRDGQPLISLASAVPSTTVKEIVSFVGSYCGQMAAGAVPATTDGNTVSWLTQNLGTLRALLGR